MDIGGGQRYAYENYKISFLKQSKNKIYTAISGLNELINQSSNLFIFPNMTTKQKMNIN